MNERQTQKEREERIKCAGRKHENRPKSTKDNEVKPDGRKDKHTPQSDLYRASFPIYYIGKLCGLVPVRFITPNTGRCQARLNIIDLVYSLCVLMLLLGMEIWGLWRDLKDGWEHSTRLKSRTAVIATCSDVLGVMSLTVVCIVGSPFRWKYLQVVLNKLVEVDKKVGISSTKSSRRFTICLTTCSLGYLWLNSILDYYTWNRKTKDNKEMIGQGPVNYTPLYFMYTVIISTEIQYTVSTYNVGQRFIKLNNSLENLFDNASMTDYYGKYVGTATAIGDVRKQTFELGSCRNFRNLNGGKRNLRKHYIRIDNSTFVALRRSLSYKQYVRYRDIGRYRHVPITPSHHTLLLDPTSRRGARMDIFGGTVYVVYLPRNQDVDNRATELLHCRRGKKNGDPR
ncbi:gustatory receptor for sugar taste 43a isoform X7 [Ptiloglossa arizonensis]|uniref:gustatory receptor for sugar taste 43a isoform X7 n=1 Tax=Ptiloglossa arizonensis TaxID=3350558 RepID=UPI003FA061EE